MKKTYAIVTMLWMLCIYSQNSFSYISEYNPLQPKIYDVPQLPYGNAMEPELMPHFPDRLHTFVFRNWNLVELDKLAKILGTSSSKVVDIARSMGLPEYKAPQWTSEQIYITLIKRNWHLLPYEQLLELVDMTPERLNSVLREDDFLWVKVGHSKPKCESLLYAAPTKEVSNRTKEIKKTLGNYINKKHIKESKEPFSFIDEIKAVNTVSPMQSEHRPNKESLRFIYSYFALFGDPLVSDKEIFAEGLLEKLSASGVNGIWLHVLLRDLAPGGEAFPEFGVNHEKRLKNLSKAVDLAAKYGVSIYLYLNEPRAMHASFFQNTNVKGREQTRGVREGEYHALCTSNEDVRNWIRNSLSHIFTTIPKLGGVFTISGSENLTFCNSHGGWQNCPRCKDISGAEVIADANALIAEGVHRASPDAKVLVWDWGWNRHGIATDVIEKLPKDVWLMSVSEWALPIERGGVKSKIGEYSISAVGPGPRAKEHWLAAQNNGLRTAAKIQLNCTWEIATVPYIPVMDLIVEHCSNLTQSGVEGFLLSWSLGAYPSPNLEVPLYFDRTPIPSKEQVLDEIAEKRYGKQGAKFARQAWTMMSNAYREYPFSGSVVYYSPVQIGPANLLRAHASGLKATMTGFPYDDLNRWRSPYPAEAFEQQYRKMAAGFAEAIPVLEKATTLADKDMRGSLMDDLRYSKVVRIHFASVANQIRYILLRDEHNSTDTPVERKTELASEIKLLIENEIILTQELYYLMQEDSKIGFESANQYLYVQNDLLEKIINCRYILTQL